MPKAIEARSLPDTGRSEKSGALILPLAPEAERQLEDFLDEFQRVDRNAFFVFAVESLLLDVDSEDHLRYDVSLWVAETYRRMNTDGGRRPRQNRRPKFTLPKKEEGGAA